MKQAWGAALAATLLLVRLTSAWAETPAATISGPPPDASAVTNILDGGADKMSAAPTVEPVMELVPSHAPEGDAPAGGHFTAGAGFYYLQPYFQTNPAYGPVRSGSVSTDFQQQDFHYGMHADPVAWLGYFSDSGLGVRVRWWQFNVSSSVAIAVPEGFPVIQSAPVLGVEDFSTRGFSTSAAFASDLHLSVWDLDVSQDFTLGRCACVLAGGVRYAHMAQDYAAGLAINDVNAGVGTLTDTLTFSHNFNGAGPTIGFEGHRPLGQTGLALYGNARGSILFGSAHQRLYRASLLVGPPFTQTEIDAASVLPVGELEVGAEYGHSFGRWHLFAQVAFVGQIWYGAGNASNTDGIFTSGSGNNTNLGLVGLAFRAGADF